MISLAIIVLLIVSLVVSKSRPKVAGGLDLGVAGLLLLFRIIPGTADMLDWIFMILFLVGGLFLLFKDRIEEYQESSSTGATQG